MRYKEVQMQTGASAVTQSCRSDVPPAGIELKGRILGVQISEAYSLG